ncbi:MAG: hypothetical protein K6G61_09320 [Solobacterium sp.]|nr:hypothetical protein [Solobacterium sp.]
MREFEYDWADSVYVLIESFTRDETISGYYDHIRYIVCGRDLQEAAEAAEGTGFLDVFIDPVPLVLQLRRDMTITIREERDVYTLNLIADADRMFHEIIKVFDMSRAQFNGIRRKTEIDRLLDSWNDACMSLDFHMNRFRYSETMKPSRLMNDICLFMEKEEREEAMRILTSIPEDAFLAIYGFFINNEGAPGPMVLFSGDTGKCTGILKLFADHANRFDPGRCVFADVQYKDDSAEGQDVPKRKMILHADSCPRPVLQKAVREMIMHGDSVILVSGNPESWTLCFENAVSVKV